MNGHPARVLHIITGLSTGGAEMMLFKLLGSMDPCRFESEVVSLTGPGPVGEKISALGVRVRFLNMRNGISAPLALLRLIGWIRREPPNLIQTWMPHANLIGGVAGRLSGGIPLVWGIRSSWLDDPAFKRSTVWVAKMGALLSRQLPTKIVYCSEAARSQHREMGYSAAADIVIPNGFDIQAFRPAPGARRAVRKQLGLDEDTLIIGLAAHFDHYKDFSNFVRAAARLHRRYSEVQFVLAGDGVQWSNLELGRWITEAGLRNIFHLLGRRDDMPRLMASLDILCVSSSSGEAFPNVVGEAMACAVPCVVTDVGDSAMIVGDTGNAVPPNDSPALAGGLEDLISAGKEARKKLGLAGRRRIRNNFNLPEISRRYDSMYSELLKSQI